MPEITSAPRYAGSEFKFDVRHAPNIAVPADRDPRERGLRPPNLNRLQ